MAAAGPKPVVMVNSCTGKMGRAVAEAATRAGLQVLPFTLCGAGEVGAKGATIEVAGQAMQLVGPAERDAVIERLKQQHPNLVMVDYTVPGARRRPCPAVHPLYDDV
jgi:4-hydroxy-tetrahydrodipicolinate reductase